MRIRYRFDLESCDDAIPDETGVFADDIDLAIEEAAAVIREMRANGGLVKEGDHWELVIRDEEGAELKRLAI